MDYFLRLIALALLLVAPGVARAVNYEIEIAKWVTGVTVKFTDKSQAGVCTKAFQAFKQSFQDYGSDPSRVTGGTVDGPRCWYNIDSSPRFWTIAEAVPPPCPPGTVRDEDGSCVSPCELMTGQSGPPYTGPMQPNYGADYTCSGGCMLSSPPYGCGGAVGSLSDGSAKCLYKPVYTGDTCEDPQDNNNSGNGKDDPAKPPNTDDRKKPPPCPTGQCSGTVNGTSVCVACGERGDSKNTSQSSSETKTNPDGSTTTTTTTKDTTTTTTCRGTSCTTTTTTTTSGSGGGNGTSSESEETSADEFCTKNPSSVLCAEEDEEENSWGGSCEAQYVCKGDAVQCAQAEAAWLTTCSLRTDRNHAAVTEGNQAMQGTSNQTIRNELGMDATSAFSLASMLDASPLFGGSGGCPAGTSVTLGGGTYAISFGPLCDSARVAGVALQAFAYLIAAFIVFRRS